MIANDSNRPIDPTRVTSTSSSAASTKAVTGTASGSDTTATGNQAFTGFGGSTTATGGASPQLQVFAIGYGRVYGLITVLASVFAGFMIML